MCNEGGGEAAETEDNEIEITPEMIEAGISEFVRYNGRFEGPEDAVDSIYRAMELARRGIGANPADSRDLESIDPAWPKLKRGLS